MSITPLPSLDRTSASFKSDVDTFFGTKMPTFCTEMNAAIAALNAIAAGTACAIQYTFSTTTTDADPGAGYLRLGSATQNTATVIRADLVGADGSTWTSMIDTFDDSTSTIKGHIMLQKLGDATKWLLFSVSSLASPSGYKNITVANVASSAASPFSDGDSIILKFTRTGDKGDQGTAGTNGTNGINAGLSYTYSSSTTASDPTSGKLKFNNATLSSATALYISETDANANVIGAELATWDDSTATVKGTLKAYKSNDPTKFAVFQITGSVTDNGTWDTFNLTYVAGGGAFSDGDPLTLTFARTGDNPSIIGNHEVVLHSGNGHGSTNTMIRRYTTALVNTGTAMTYADSASNGMSVTINESGLYNIYIADRTAGGTPTFGVTVNSAQLTTSIASVSTSALVCRTTSVSDKSCGVSRTVYLTAGDVVRAHTDSTPGATDDRAYFSIRKVGVIT